ncbi:EpsG family protein [Enterobacter huaxiensis]|uniref:EpsG family protein n=1 Tax=Enterobacter huaxiensis TaxID=2494702 RepID=A0ABU6EQC2_9ENTR|nr:EpsG family protein [Enterobacter huaxiensis]MEB7543266.1 EpsG family protein [Enterobacter huaxiensis]MEB7579704.1 EpsG family protein [Enterobacter huaxiensis]MEB7662098.1 EpsG family protein [Enterobacter huaxiensis]
MINQSYSKVMSFALTIMFSVFFTVYYFNGVDWLNYYYVFDFFKSEFDIRYDLLFNIYLYLAANVLDVFQLAVFIFYVFSFYLLYRLTKVSVVTLNGPAFITCVVFLGGMALVLDQIRQFVAICVAFFAFNYLLNNNIKKFYRYVIIAALLHYSVLFIVIFRLLINLSKKKIILSGFIVIALFVFLGGFIIFNLGFVSNIPLIGPELYRKVAIYVRELDSYKVEIGFGVLADILIVGYYLFRRERGNELDKLWALAFMSACFHVAFYFMPAFSRFNYFSLLPLSYIFSHALTSRRNKMGVAQFVTIMCAVTLTMVIVTVKAFTDAKRPAWDEYSASPFLYNSQELDELRSARCAALNNELDDFCATY